MSLCNKYKYITSTNLRSNQIQFVFISINVIFLQLRVMTELFWRTQN